MKRDLHSMTLRTPGPNNKLLQFSILQVFPFTSETKRMGVIVKVRFCGVQNDEVANFKNHE